MALAVNTGLKISLVLFYAANLKKYCDKFAAKSWRLAIAAKYWVYDFTSIILSGTFQILCGNCPAKIWRMWRAVNTGLNSQFVLF